MSNSTNLQIYYAEDHAIVANALSGLLLNIKNVSHVNTFSNGKLLFEALLIKNPHLVILDMEMPEWDGLFTLKKIREKSNCPVIMLSMNDEKTLINDAIQSGANAYLNKNCSELELQNAIEHVMDGKIFLSAAIQKIVLGIEGHTNSNFQLEEPLTGKELEVLKLVCEGLSSKEIGEKLFISSRTVETRKTHLMQKFGVQTTGKLISIAIKNKWVK